MGRTRPGGILPRRRGVVAARRCRARLARVGLTVPVIELPLGGRLVVAGNLESERVPSGAATAAVSELIVLLDAWDGPGVFVVCDEQKVVEPYPRLNDALNKFSSDASRNVVYLAEDETLDVSITTGIGTRRVRVVRGNTAERDRGLLAEGYCG